MTDNSIMPRKPHIRLYSPRRKVTTGYGEHFEGRLDISGGTFLNCTFGDCDLYAATPANFMGAVVIGKVKIRGVWHCPIFGAGGPRCGCDDCTALYYPLLTRWEAGFGSNYIPGATA